MKSKLLFFFSLITLQGFSQTISLLNPRRFFVVDSIPLYKLPTDEHLGISDSSIYKKEITSDIGIIKKYQKEEKIDEVVFIITKQYHNRLDSIKKIPSYFQLSFDEIERAKLTGTKKYYTGNFINYFLNGNIKSRGQCLDGKLNGTIISYNITGQKMLVRNFDKGALDGEVIEFYANGNLKSKIMFNKGEMDGKNEEWFENGKKKKEVSYKNNSKYGDETIWYSTGNIKSFTKYFAGNAILDYNQRKVKNLFEEAKFKRRNGYPHEGLAIMDRAIKYDSLNTDLHVFSGILALEAKLFDTAYQSFTKAIQIEYLEQVAYIYRVRSIILKYEPPQKNIQQKKDEVEVEALMGDYIEIPKEDELKICSDLNILYAIGNSKIKQEAIKMSKMYCKQY